MSRSSLSSRRSNTKSSPERPSFLASFLHDRANTELSHRDALAAAQAEHDRVREAAIRVFDLHTLEEERRKVEAELEREQERLRRERELVAEEQRLRALKAQKIPRPPPEPEPEPEQAPPQEQTKPKTAPAPAPAPSRPTPTAPVPSTSQKEQSQPAAPVPAPAAQPVANGVPAAQPPRNPFGQPAAGTTQSPTPNPFSQQLKPQEPKPQLSEPVKPTPVPQPAPTPAAAPAPTPDRHLQIHQELKKLRKQLEDLAKTPNSQLKGKMGDMRREIRKSMGQLTGGKGANAKPINKIKDALRESLSGSIPSPLVNVATFVADDRQPQPDAVHNGEQFPSLFIYLVNIFSKSIVNQFINECGASPKSADPIGVVAAQIFSDKDFQWRGGSMIDILLAKFRRSCPVLFGVRGTDKTAQGRTAIGWRKDGGSWMPEQMHFDRMAGLGAGFAAVSLRDFSKANKANPFPPTHYWRALAGIVNTPAAQVSDTQYIVLKAMIDGHEQRFLHFYGNAGLAALRVALVEFPKKAPGSVAAGGLRVLGEVLRTEKGLDLD
ncbi:related to RNA export mediator GLE1 [Cephalotrichum gorgonifer]|uniref:mRNA export factor GLE1 n=1 Tax=Cephalotrichum gorgonifer TaxID=2041049 RepID=A0AAE8MQG7_9PEZI|nr:related to RNA export mediator GLE1 [Cephalotrichum gorgonifer]